ncbi:hypothetical protein Tco_0356281 [Tanacetum coccineum]
MKHPTSSTNLHSTTTRHTRVSFVEGTLTRALIVKQGTHPSMISVLVTIKILVLTNLYIILRVSHNNSTVVRSVEEMLNLRNLNQDPPVDLYDLKGSDERNNEIDSLTKVPSDTLLMGDEVISTTPERENDEFIKFSVDDLVPIPRESEVTPVCDDLQCDIPVNTPLPTTDVRHLVKRLFSHLVKNPSFTKGMSDEPLGGDSKPISYDETFSNSLFDFNNDFTLCNDNLLFDEEFEDVNINLLLGEHLDTLSTGDREIDFNPSRDIEELERLLADDPIPAPRVFDEPLDTSSDVSPSLLPTKSSSLDLPLSDPKKICLSEVERFDPFFSLTQSGGKTRVMETPSFGFHHMPSPRPAAYSPTEVMYCYYHPHLTSGDGFDHGPKMK